MAELRFLLKPGEAVNLFAVSVDPPDKTRSILPKITADGKGDIAYTLLSDPDHATIDRYGLHDARYDGKTFAGIPLPATYVLDRKGRVVWSRVDPDYKKRPTNQEIREALVRVK